MARHRSKHYSGMDAFIHVWEGGCRAGGAAWESAAYTRHGLANTSTLFRGGIAVEKGADGAPQCKGAPQCAGGGASSGGSGMSSGSSVGSSGISDVEVKGADTDCGAV